MNNGKYMIGDLANLIGMSRDTLRYYEKRGLLSSEKGENGYRYYTEQDVNRLTSILYQRKMNIGLEDMADLWSPKDSSDHPDQLIKLIEGRLEEEYQAIQEHRRTIARLQMTRDDCNNIRNHQGEVFLTGFPDSYIIEPQADLQSSIRLWFEYSRKYAGLDMVYIFDEYTWEECGDAFHIQYHNSQLLLKQDTAEYTEYPITEKTRVLTSPALCASTFCTSQSRVPSKDVIRPLLEWARSQELSISRQLYATYTMQGVCNGEQSYFLQLYLPVF